MKNLENEVAYLTAIGASCLLGSEQLIGLPVVPTSPTDVDGHIVYDEAYELNTGEFIGGCVPQDHLTDEPTTIEHQIAAQMVFDREHRGGNRTIDIKQLLGRPKVFKIPTLKERVARRDAGQGW